MQCFQSDHEGVIMRRVSVLLAVMLLGCAPSTPEVPEVATESATVTQVPQTMTAWPSESPTPTKSPEQQAAEAVVAEYFRLKNEIKQDPTKDMEPLRAIVTGEVPEADIALLEQDRAQGLVQIGDFKSIVTNSKLISTKEVIVTACTDASSMDLIDASSRESVLDKNRNYFKDWTIEATQVESQWKLSDFATKDVDSCHSQ